MLFLESFKCLWW